MKITPAKIPGASFFLAAASVATLVLFSSTAAHAHARMVRSLPAKSAAMGKPPQQVELWFNELLDDDFNTVEVFPSSEAGAKKRTNFAKDKPVVDAKNRSHLSAKLKPLPPGEYILEWRVLSRDGHSAPGRITFRVTGEK
jgi:methionine-rich copper-binding protein CopC